MKESFRSGPTHKAASSCVPVCRKNAEERAPEESTRSSWGTSCVASSATSFMIRSYNASCGVLLDTSLNVSASPDNQASLRSRMLFATAMYVIPNATALPKAKASVVQTAIRQAAVFLDGLRSFENIADSTNCLNERFHAFPIDFGAQPVDM